MHQRQTIALDPQGSFAGETTFIAYSIATFAVSVATFGAGGIVLGMAVPVYWACVLAPRSVWFRITLMISLALMGLFFLALSTPLHGPGHREATWRMSCSNNLKSVAIALHNYHDIYKSFPPAYVEAEDGQRRHSWRVLILPYIDDQQQLYDAYNFDEPWNGPNNSELILKMPHVYCCPSQCKRGSEPTGITNYVAVVGENTVWPGEQAIGLADVSDGTSNTLLLLEVANRPIVWTEPTDIDRDEAINILAARERSPHPSQSFFYDRPVGYNFAFVDGSVRFVAQQVDGVTSDLLITRNDGKPFRSDSLRNDVDSSTRLRLRKCIFLGLFTFLAVLPLPWVWINPRGKRAAIHSDEQMKDEQ